MTKIKAFLTLTVFLTCFSLYSAEKTTVAVLNFKNFGNKNLANLSMSIPEAVSSSLSNYDKISVVERNNLEKLVNELALSKTGLFSKKNVNRVGKLLNARILILGSISGNAKNVIVSIKAVRVETGQIIAGRVVQGNIVDITHMSSHAARSMGALISGRGIGYLTISATPSGSTIIIDGVKAGVSPVVNYKLTKGYHKVHVVHKDYLEHSTTVYIKNKQFKTIKPYLVKKSDLNKYELSFGAYLDIPAAVPPLAWNDLQLGFLVNVAFGYQFINFVIKGEFNFGGLWHSQFFSEPLGTVDMNYFYMNLLLHFNYIPITSWKYAHLYFGGFLGGSLNLDNQPGNPEEQNTHFVFNIGVTAGINILPFSKVSIFVEGRYYFYAPQLTLPQYGVSGFFLTKETPKSFFLTGGLIGLGVRFNF